MEVVVRCRGRSRDDVMHALIRSNMQATVYMARDCCIFINREVIFSIPVPLRLLLLQSLSLLC